MASTAPAAARVLRFGDFELDPESGELRKNGVAIRLQEQPFRILLELLQRPGEVVTRAELRERLWPADTFVDFETSLNSAVRKLREALDDSAESPQYIETLKRRGYRFIVPASVPPPLARRKWLWLVPVALAIVVGVVIWTMWPATAPIDSIAVLPLDNLSGDAQQEYFADGMTDALITNLAQIKDLRVISRTSVIQYKGVRKSLPAIARELDVDAIVEGTVSRSGSRVRVTAQLIHAATDRHLWAKSFEREMVDIFSLQGEVAQAIADAVEVNVAPQVRAGLTNVPRMNPEAVDAFFRGVVASKPQQAGDYAKAIGHYERAVAIEPDFALAHAWIARLHFQSAYTADAPPKVFMPKTESAARRAITIDPRLSEGHVILANVLHRFHWDWRGAESEFRKALDVNPGDAAAHRAYAGFLTLLGRVDEANAERETARVLDPKIAEAYLDQPRRSSQGFDRNIAVFRSNLQKNPTTRVYFQLGSALVMDGQFAEGIKMLEASKPERHARYLAYLGYAYAASGDKKKGRELLEEMRRRAAKQYVSGFSLALVHAGLGENDSAMEQLEHAYDEHAFELAQLNITPAFDPLRGEPRFQALVRKLGLTM